MHSRIFQISKYPIKQKEYFDTSRYDYGEHEGFVGEIADYVDNGNDRLSDIQWFKECYGTSLEFISKDKFKVIDKRNYFKGRVEAFFENIKELQNVKEDDFIQGSKIPMLMCLTESIYRDRFGFYIDRDDTLKSGEYDEFFGPMDDFMRDAEEGEEYYIGNTIDYHY